MTARIDTRPNEKKVALPGASRGASMFKMDARSLWIAGYDDEDEAHWSFNLSAHDPIDENLKSKLKRTEGNLIPVLVVREGERVYVKDGRDRVKAMRCLAVEAEAAGEPVLLVECKVVRRSREGEHFSDMVDANAARKVDNPITRANLAMRAAKYMTEEEAAELIGVGVPMMRQLQKLIDLIPECQAAVANGTWSIRKGLSVHGKSVADQRAALTTPAAPKAKGPKRPAQKRLASVLANAETWEAAGGSERTHRDVVTVLAWAAGKISDDELAKRLPHLCAS